MRRSIMMLLTFALVVAACSGQGSDPNGPSTTTAVEPTSESSTTESLVTTTSTTESLSTTTAVVTTTAADTTTTTTVEYDVVIESGDGEGSEVSVYGPEVFEQTVGDEIAITVFSSVEDEIHVHGYDIRFDVTPSEVTVVAFTADVMGIFEVELEDNHVPLFLIEVAP